MMYTIILNSFLNIVVITMTLSTYTYHFYTLLTIINVIYHGYYTLSLPLFIYTVIKISNNV